MRYEKELVAYQQQLEDDERSKHTIKKYVRDIKKFLKFLADELLDKGMVLEFKKMLLKTYAPTSVNSILAGVNGFLVWLGFPQYKVKPIKLQKDLYLLPEKELLMQEYQRLIQLAESKKNRRLSLLIQTICATGIRVSELEYITVEAIRQGKTSVYCKGKNRVIFIPTELCKCLTEYCESKQIVQGCIFITKEGNPMDRSNIWRMMKKLSKEMELNDGKVFPHNLRHLFARSYYQINKDILRLADLLGHSSVDTTRIYTMESGEEHAKLIEEMNLIYG